MEQKNLLLAIILSALIMVGFQWYNSSQKVPEPGLDSNLKSDNNLPELPASSKNTGNQIRPDTPITSNASNMPVPIPVENSVNEASEAIKKALTTTPRIIINSDRISGSISLVGARIDDMILKNYRETIEPESKNISLLLPFGSFKPYYAEFGWLSRDTKVPDATTVWKSDSRTLIPEEPIQLTWQNGDGIKFIHEIFLDQNFMFTVNQRVENTGTRSATVYPYGLVKRHGTPEITDFYILHEGMLGVFDDVLQEVDYDEIVEKKQLKKRSKGGWIGITDKYWLTALIPDQNSAVDTHFSGKVTKGVENYQVDFRGDAQVVAPGTSAQTSSKFFSGAKEAQLILDYRDQLNIARFDLAIDWGWFEFLTKPIFFALVYFTDYLGNMGLSILLLTVLIKLAFFPLANKSYRAMSKMKLLQPEMMKIRDRFKDDKTKMNQEVMQLYKREKANPAAGCLPILPQIPVFFALYKVVFVTIELRHAPFYGWIKDLSAADPVTPLNLFGLINWTPPEMITIGIWPIIMGVTMYIQQKLNPPPPDPMQAKIFMFLPKTYVRWPG